MCNRALPLLRCVQLDRLSIGKKATLTIALHFELDVERVYERYAKVVDNVIAAGKVSSLRAKAQPAPPPAPVVRAPAPVVPPPPPPPVALVAPPQPPLPLEWACRCDTPASAFCASNHDEHRSAPPPPCHTAQSVHPPQSVGPCGMLYL